MVQRNVVKATVPDRRIWLPPYTCLCYRCCALEQGT